MKQQFKAKNGQGQIQGPVWVLESPHSLIQMEKAKTDAEVSEVNQKGPPWGAGRNVIDLGRMIPVGIMAKRQEGQSLDSRIKAEEKSEMDQVGGSSPPGVFLQTNFISTK